MKKDYRSYVMLKFLDMAKKQAVLWDTSLSKEEREELARAFDSETIKTILNAEGQEFDSAKALIELTRKLSQDEEEANRVIIHKLSRRNYGYKADMAEVLSIPTVQNYLLRARYYNSPASALIDINSLTDHVIGVCYTNGFLDRRMERKAEEAETAKNKEIKHPTSYSELVGDDFLDFRLNRESSNRER